MKYLLVIALMFVSGYAYSQESCKVTAQDVNTPVPQALKGKEICIRDPKTGVSDCMPTEEFKVVKRKQQFKIKEVVVETKVVEKIVIKQEEGHKNLLLLGGRRGYNDIDTKISGNTASVGYEKGVLLDLSYFRRQVILDFGLGIGLDTDGKLRGTIGYEF